MYRKIISALDGSFHSELAARYAVAIAASCGSDFLALAVDIGGAGEDRLSISVEHVCQYARDKGVNARSLVRKGGVVKTILDAAYSEHADLLVTATRRSDYRFFVRSVPQQLMLKAPCSVLAVKPAGMAKKGTGMLLPVAHREIATDERVILASSLAKYYQYRVEVLHIVERRHWYNLSREKLNTLLRHGEENMMPIINGLKERGIASEVRTVISENSMNAIQKEVAVGKYDLVLFGANHRNILKQIISGNPIEQALSGILSDVIIWRPKP